MNCPSCNSSDLYKKGNYTNRKGTVHKFQCKKCKKQFCDSIVYNMNHTKEEIEAALNVYDEYYRSLEEVRRVLKTKGIDITTTTLSRWITKYEFDYDMGKGLWEGEGHIVWTFVKNKEK